MPRMLDLPGPSRRIRVEPLRLPEPVRETMPSEQPSEPVREDAPEREPVPA